LKHAIKKKKTILNNFKAINHQVQAMKDDVFLTEALDLIIGKFSLRIFNFYHKK